MTQPLPLALDQLLIKPIAVGGTPVPSRRYLNLVSGATYADNPNFVDADGIVAGSTDVTIVGAASYAPPAFYRVSANYTMLPSQAGLVVLCDTTMGAFTLKLPTSGGSPAAGDAWECWVIDSKGQFATHALTVTTDLGTVPLVNPQGIGSSGATANSLVLSAIRGSVRFKYALTEGLYVVV